LKLSGIAVIPVLVTGIQLSANAEAS